MIIKFILIIFFFFILLVGLLGFSLFRSLRRVFFGNDRSRTDATGGSASRKDPHDRNSASGPDGSRGHSYFRRKKKIIGKDEGEYVDYEEIKD